MSKEKVNLEYLKALTKKPIIEVKSKKSMSRRIAEEFFNSGLEYAELVDLSKFNSPEAAARSIGRQIKDLDPEGKIQVASSKGKVYLIRKS